MRWVYYLIVFISGAAVMAFELLSAKAIAPYYGFSLFVWSAAIGVTLAALSLGYFVGGVVIDRWPSMKVVFWVLIASAVLTGGLPLVAAPIMKATERLGLRAGAMVACVLFLMPPLTAMGMISPSVIRLATQQVERVGNVSGTIYAVSTVGGILATFACGFWLIPYVGVRMTALTFAVLLGAAAFVAMLQQKRFEAITGAGVIALALGAGWIQSVDETNRYGESVLLYRSEGLLGRLVVYQQTERVPPKWTVESRVFMIDGVGQTKMRVDDRTSMWDYVHIISHVASMYPAGSRALVLGMGGGTLANEFAQLGFAVDAVELDPRVVEVARRFFHLDQRVIVHIDDARRFARHTDKTYKVIAIDCFTGEREPTYLLSTEAFSDFRRVLENDGVLAINYLGLISGPRGRGARCIYKTLVASGLIPDCVSTARDEENSNLIFFAAKDPSMLGDQKRRPNPCCESSVKKAQIIRPDAADGVVLTDDCSALDVWNVEYHELWRKSMLKGVDKRLLLR